jgi:hypothetical protein
VGIEQGYYSKYIVITLYMRLFAVIMETFLQTKREERINGELPQRRGKEREE